MYPDYFFSCDYDINNHYLHNSNCSPNNKNTTNDSDYHYGNDKVDYNNDTDPLDDNPAGIYMFKVNNRNTRTRCKICSKLTKNITV